jgi:hypothetical protein
MYCFGLAPRRMGLAAKRNGHGVRTARTGCRTPFGEHLNLVARSPSSAAPGNMKAATWRIQSCLTFLAQPSNATFARSQFTTNHWLTKFAFNLLKGYVPECLSTCPTVPCAKDVCNFFLQAL